MFGHFYICAKAYDFDAVTGTQAAGADISGYESAIAVDVIDFGADPSGKRSSGAAIQKALDYAKKNASPTVQVKVVIPSGTYGLEQTLYVYSNTWLCMDSDTVLRKDFRRGCMIRNAMQNNSGGYDADSNIIISGGCLDGNTTSGTAFCHLRMAHMRNVWIKDVEFINNVNCHHAEFGGVQNLTIEGCTFSGYHGSKLKEAVQLDAMNSSNVFDDFEPFDDTCCDNVVIKNNKFSDLMRGLGSHSATLGVYYTNIVVSGNTFENIKDCAVIMMNYKNCIIEDNTMKNVGSGIQFKYMTANEYSGYNAPVNGYDAVNIDDFANTVIRKNTINTSVTSQSSKAAAIQVYGRELKSSLFPEHNYRVEGVLISDNVIKTSGIAVQLIDTFGVMVSSNMVTYDDSGDHYEFSLNEIKDSNDTVIRANTISGGPQSGIYINGGSGSFVSDNSCAANGASGIYVSNAARDIRLVNNTVDKSGSSAVTVNKSSEAELSGNTLKNSKGSGALINSAKVIVAGNTFSGNLGNGIDVKNAKAQEISANSFIGNTGFAIFADDSGEALVDSNSFVNNTGGKYGTNGSGRISTQPVNSFAADGIYNDHVQLSWEAAGEVEGYSVKRRIKDSGEEYSEIAKVNTASFVDSGLAPRTGYEYRIDGVLTVNGEDTAVSGSQELSVRTKASLSECTADLEPSYRYSGRRIEPDFHLYLDGCALVPDIDYKVSYKNNLAIGKATVVVTGCGEYFGFKELDFEISASSGKLADSDEKVSVGIISDASGETSDTASFGGTASRLVPSMSKGNGRSSLFAR